MKIRMGFVSNSSSSSFVIHRSYLTDAQIDDLLELYSDLKGKDLIYDDNGCYFDIQAKYIGYTMHGGDGVDVFNKKLKQFGIVGDKIMRMD